MLNNPQRAFGELFYRTLETDAGIYLRASLLLMQQHLLNLALDKHWVLDESDVARLRWTSVLEPALRPRLEEHKRALEQRLQRMSRPRPSHCFCNLSQNACYTGAEASSLSVFPTLIKNSVLVGIGSAAPEEGLLIHPFVHFARNGLPGAASRQHT